jgi:hypothetical protein
MKVAQDLGYLKKIKNKRIIIFKNSLGVFVEILHLYNFYIFLE